MKKIINIIFALILGLATSALAANVDPARFTQGTNPVVSAPTFTITGTPGTTSATYYIVCHDSLGNISSPSAATIVNTVPNTLNASNFIRLNWNNNCTSVDVLKNSIYTALAIGATVGSTADVGQGLVAYNPVLPPLTGALNLIGPAIIQGSLSTPPVSKTIQAGDYIDFTAGALQVGTLTTNSTITLSNPSNGQHLILEILQDSSGNHTLSFTTVPGYTISWIGGAVPTISGTVNTYSNFSFYVVGTTVIGSMNTTGSTTGTFTNLSANGAISITGASNNGSDTVSNLCVNGVCPVTAFGAKGDCNRTGSNSTCTDNTTAILAACAQAKTKGQTVLFPSASNATQTVYYAASPLPGCVGVNLSMPPQPQLANGDGSGLKVILRGGTGQDIFAPGDPTAVGYIKPSGSYTWTNMALEVDNTTDVSANFPHRKPGRTVVDVTLANGGTTVTSPTAFFEPGDYSPIQQSMEIVGAGTSACDAAIGGSNCLITPITGIGTLVSNTRHSNTATITNAASTAACASGGCTAYISMGSLPVTATIGNCGLAYDQTNGTSVSARAAGARFDNTSILTKVTGNNSCGMYFQGSQDPYGVHWIDLSIKGPTFDIFAGCSDQNPASANCGWSDFNVIDHAQFGEPAPYPFTAYMGGWDRITNFQIGGDEHGIQLIEANNVVGESIDNWTIDQVEDECNSECSLNVSGWRVSGLDNHISNATLETKSGPAAIWDASDSTCVSCQTALGGLLQLGSDRNQIGLTSWNSTTVTNTGGKGNDVYGTRPTSALNGVAPVRPSDQFGSTNSRRTFAFTKTADFISTHDLDFPYNNIDDMWIWPPSAYATGGTNPAIVADSTSETGAYFAVGTGGIAITAIDGTQIAVGTHIPATKCRVYIKLKANSGTPTQSINIKGNGNSLAFISPTLSTSYSLVSADVDYTGLTGDTATFNFSAGSGVDVAWIAVVPEPEYLNVNGQVFGRAGVGTEPAILSAFGTCNASSEGLYGLQSDAPSCAANATATGTGTPSTTGHCQIVCNYNGSTYQWLQFTPSGIATPVSPVNGGVGLMKGAPLVDRFFGNGEDGAGPAGPITINQNKNYTGWNCTGVITVSGSLIVRSQGAVTLGSSCVINTTNQNNGTGSLGGSSGGSGGGAAAGTAGLNTYPLAAPVTAGFNTYTAGGSAGTSSGGNGGNASSVSSVIKKMAIATGAMDWFMFSGAHSASCGGSISIVGANSGGAAVNGAGCVKIVAPSITIASGMTITTNGLPGNPAPANSEGASSGSGGGPIELEAETITDNGGQFFVGGGSPGSNVTPQVNFQNGANDVTGTGALAHVSALSGGNPSTIVIDNAGTGYTTTPLCSFTGGAGTGATCTCTLSGSTVASCTASGGNGAYILTTFTTAGLGGYGGNAWIAELLFQ